MSPQGRILFIDAYDSFSNNIINLLRDQLKVTVETIKIDDPRFVLNDDAFFNFLQYFDAVVAGPGPGHPANQRDAGLISKLWVLPEDHLLPVLGICFGFQSLALHFGATVEKLREPRHGMVASVLHCDRDIFAGTGDIVATRYHSLHVRLRDTKPTRNNRTLWTPSRSCKELIPLAWDISDADNGTVLMALRHCHEPFWGVQYHPESICTNPEGGRLISNWWNEAMIWRSQRPSKRDSMEPESISVPTCRIEDKASSAAPAYQAAVNWRSLEPRDHVNIPDIVRELRTEHFEPIVLESGTRNNKAVNDETGRFSIIGMHDASSIHTRYSVKTRRLDVVMASNIISSKVTTISETFKFLETFTKERAATGGPANVPFWGGLVGFVSYEAGLETIDVRPSETKEDQPDIWFVFVERSLVIDNVDGTVHIQSIRADGDDDWLSSIEKILERIQASNERYLHYDHIDLSSETTMTSAPKSQEYQHKVRQCQDHLRAGSSYELCLTDTTRIRTAANPWNLYLRLRSTNPAPFGAYMRFPSTVPSTTEGNLASFQGISIISSSPERFLSWSRTCKCQFRPIKGTTKKTPGTDRTKAEELLNCPKERAENLMIVDLIRHDLNGVKGVRDVRVPKLMQVEEYETVFQLVSVIEGDLNDEEGSGVDVLAASLPPGSMTGAPKKRSCELLKEIENDRPRGLYSGVLGYLDVGGGGDFSVVIRTAFKWDNEEEWRVGAGGAVTALSEPEAEWMEMNAKRESVLATFGVGGREG